MQDVSRLYPEEQLLVRVSLIEGRKILSAFNQRLQQYAEKKIKARGQMELIQSNVTGRWIKLISDPSMHYELHLHEPCTLDVSFVSCWWVIGICAMLIVSSMITHSDTLKVIYKSVVNGGLHCVVNIQVLYMVLQATLYRLELNIVILDFW